MSATTQVKSSVPVPAQLGSPTMMSPMGPPRERNPLLVNPLLALVFLALNRMPHRKLSMPLTAQNQIFSSLDTAGIADNRGPCRASQVAENAGVKGIGAAKPDSPQTKVRRYHGTGHVLCLPRWRTARIAENNDFFLGNRGTQAQWLDIGRFAKSTPGTNSKLNK